MKKVVLYFGPKRAFLKMLPRKTPRVSLTDLALRSDARQREHLFKIQGRKPSEPEQTMLKEAVPCVVAFSDEYAAISESAISGFLAFLSQFDVEMLYLQNPPYYLVEQLGKLNQTVKLARYQYRSVDAALLRRLDREYDQSIVGQQEVKRRLLTALYPLCRPERTKPVVLLFYGPTGVGKTETAKLLADLMGQRLFRKQFSMFHSGDFASYLFGGKHSQNCLAKELLERESNVLLFDEFDKPNPVFHSAFYQLFDEGIYHDKNYQVELERSVILCTSNYESAEEAQRLLGAPLFSRFDAVIRFDELSEQANRAILENEYAAQTAPLSMEERALLDRAGILPRLLEQARDLCNARQTKRAVQDAIARALVDELLKD